jgi:transcriptional regulator with XRE-family HTH domain
MENTLQWNGAKLKEKREKLGKSQTAVADYLQITPQSYGEMERSQIKPDSSNLVKLCIYFDCAAQDFFDIPENFFFKDIR